MQIVNTTQNGALKEGTLAWYQAMNPIGTRDIRWSSPEADSAVYYDGQMVHNKYYILASTANSYGETGWNTVSLVGTPTSPTCNALANCFGYAVGRFSELIGYPGIVYRFKGATAAEIINGHKINYAKNVDWAEDLTYSSSPSIGAAVVFAAGRTAGTAAGHVAIVEHIYSTTPLSCLISESSYGGFEFQTSRINYIDGRWVNDWGQIVKGFIPNPYVERGSNGVFINYTGGSVLPSGPLTADQVLDWAPEEYRKGNNVVWDTKYQTVTTTVRRDTLKHTDEQLAEGTSTSLLTYPTNVEAPFIMVKIGDNTFGSYTEKPLDNSRVAVTYPNFLDSIKITKVNGTVNQYEIHMIYQVQPGEDPNFLDKVFSSVSYGTIYISYGDWNSPSFVYREEEAIITKVTSSVNFASSLIEYTVQCTSNSLSLLGGTYNFSARHAKPSDVIFEMLSNNNYGLKQVFTGMTNTTQVRANNLIATDDQAVDIEAKVAMDPLSYLNYLVTCMTSIEDNTDSPIKTSTYFLTIHDDTFGIKDLDGTYFTIQKVKTDGKALSIANVYEVDIGYPGLTNVISFNINNDTSWSLLYDFSESLEQQNYVYHINDSGDLIQEFSPAITTSTGRFRTTPVQKDWWTNMTQFPITAELTIKGLLRPAVLMSYVRLNVFFFGKRHTSSGLYIITKQVDTVSGSGFRTTLSLTRVAGDQDWFETTNEEVTTTIAWSEYSRE